MYLLGRDNGHNLKYFHTPWDHFTKRKKGKERSNRHTNYHEYTLKKCKEGTTAAANGMS
jgi:hypothetical protein